MTGYESKKAAAQAKTIDEVNWADHEPNGLAQPAQEPAAWIAEFENGEQELHFEEPTIGETITPLYTAPPQPAQEPVDDVRGFLAARLTCWHRLTEKESNELVALFESQPEKNT